MDPTPLLAVLIVAAALALTGGLVRLGGAARAVRVQRRPAAPGVPSWARELFGPADAAELAACDPVVHGETARLIAKQVRRLRRVPVTAVLLDGRAGDGTSAGWGDMTVRFADRSELTLYTVRPADPDAAAHLLGVAPERMALHALELARGRARCVLDAGIHRLVLHADGVELTRGLSARGT